MTWLSGVWPAPVPSELGALTAHWVLGHEGAELCIRLGKAGDGSAG